MTVSQKNFDVFWGKLTTIYVLQYTEHSFRHIIKFYLKLSVMYSNFTLHSHFGRSLLPVLEILRLISFLIAQTETLKDIFVLPDDRASGTRLSV